MSEDGSVLGGILGAICLSCAVAAAFGIHSRRNQRNIADLAVWDTRGVTIMERNPLYQRQGIEAENPLYADPNYVVNESARDDLIDSTIILNPVMVGSSAALSAGDHLGTRGGSDMD
ncbi:MAG: hypothetical protein ACPGR1_05785, partial [Candidatus Poseidoniaceae archaeon]